MTTPTAAVRRSVHAATVERDAEESEDRFFWRNHRLEAYKLAFVAVTFGLQVFDAGSDVIAESTYFLLLSKEDQGNSTEDGVSEVLKMGLAFDIFYGMHALISLVVSGFVMWKVKSVFLHLRATRYEHERRRSGGAPSEAGEVAPAVHRAASQLHREESAKRRAPGRRGGVQQQAAEGGNGVSLIAAARSRNNVVRRARTAVCDSPSSLHRALSGFMPIRAKCR